jgi:hypothetical protein
MAQIDGLLLFAISNRLASRSGLYDEKFEPTIIGFTCNWCSYRAADLAGTARMKYPPNVRLIRMMCSGRLDPTFVLRALAGGADGVMITGCHPGECHYIEQNYKALRRFLSAPHAGRDGHRTRTRQTGLGQRGGGRTWPARHRLCRRNPRWVRSTGESPLERADQNPGRTRPEEVPHDQAKIRHVLGRLLRRL